jgi:hypothetical protein
MIEEWKNWQDKIRSLMRKKTPLAGNVEPKLQQAGSFIEELSEALILIDNDENLVKVQIHKFQSQLNRLNKMLSDIEQRVRS